MLSKKKKNELTAGKVIAYQRILRIVQVSQPQ